jgi:hypothetical protein
MTPGQTMSITLPRDTFLSTSGGQLSFKAVLVGERAGTDTPLPSWVRFNPITGVFSGEPPANAPELMHIKVIARDSKGNEAVVTFTIHNARVGQEGSKPGAVKPQSNLRGEGAWLALESADSADELAQMDAQTAVHKALTKGRGEVVGRASLSEQIRLAHRHPATGDRLAIARRTA